MPSTSEAPRQQRRQLALQRVTSNREWSGEAKAETIGIQHSKIPKAIVAVGNRLIDGHAKRLSRRPNGVHIVGDNAHVRARRPAKRRQLWNLIQEQPPVSPTQHGETTVTSVQRESERDIDGERAIEIADAYLYNKLFRDF